MATKKSTKKAKKAQRELASPAKQGAAKKAPASSRGRGAANPARPVAKKAGRPAVAKTAAKKAGRPAVAKKPAKKAAKKAGRPGVAEKAAKKATRMPAAKGGLSTATKPARPAKNDAKAAAPARRAAKAARPPIRRRDGQGHLDPKYARDLLRRSGSRRDEGSGFVARPRSADDLAETLGEEFVASATSGEHEGEDVLDQVVPEEIGGPFVESTAGAEFAEGTDASNPKDADREPFPTT